MTFEELEELTIKWAAHREIFDKSTAFKQFDKTLEEVEELAIELILFESNSPQADIDNVKSELGDVLVTLILMASFMNVSLPESLEVAYKKISKRKGKMVNGLFQKQEDLPKD